MPTFNAIPPELLWTCLQWLVITVMWLVLTWGTWREDRRIRQLHNNPLSPPEMISMLQMLHQRHVQIGILVTLLLAVEATGDLRRGMEAASPAAPAPTAADVQTAPAIPSTPPAPVPAPIADLPFSDITEFNEKDSKQQVYLDWLKQRYEAWFVTYYYLNKCAQASPKDLGLIQQALQKELDSAHAEPAIRDNILLAAAGSFKEMYRDIPCDSRHISVTKSTYEINMAPLRSPSSPPSLQNGSQP